MRLLDRRKIWEDDRKYEECQWNTKKFNVNNEFVNMWLVKKYWTFEPSHFFFFFACMYKMDLFAQFTANA